MKISLILAMGRNRAIGRDNKLPWHLPADLAHFKTTTMGKPILMGRKTWESIGKALPGRLNIVLTAQTGYDADGATVVNSIDDAISVCESADELMVIGGAGVYQAFLPRARKIYLTLIDEDFEGDTFFPQLDEQEWHEEAREDHRADDKNPYDYSFRVLRKSPGINPHA
ncbi:MAG: type 3 dihydrofolate reductase [Proteobacteria bacterium]|nr:type 3 dihydrofolate reductase [Pseudomonadota bacterium]